MVAGITFYGVWKLQGSMMDSEQYYNDPRHPRCTPYKPLPSRFSFNHPLHPPFPIPSVPLVCAGSNGVFVREMGFGRMLTMG